MNFSAILATAKSAYDAVKELRQIEAKFAHAEMREKMVDLLENIADMREALIEARDEIATKDLRIRELEEKIAAKNELIEVDGYMYKKGEDGKAHGLPFCAACLESDGTQIRPAHLIHGHYQCPRCKAHYADLRKIP